jgi:hypothetical protein
MNVVLLLSLYAAMEMSIAEDEPSGVRQNFEIK